MGQCELYRGVLVLMDIRLIKNRIKFDTFAAEITKKRALSRIQTMANAIETRFPEVTRPEQIKLKHLQFLKNYWFESETFSAATIGDYVRSMRLMITALGKDSDWFGPLALKIDAVKGGRPTLARITKSKSRLKRG